MLSGMGVDALLKISRWLTITLLALAPVSAYAESSPVVLRIAAIYDVPSTRLAIDLLDIAYGKLGRRLETSFFPSRRALRMADEGLLDGDLFRVESVAKQYPNLVQVPYPLLEGRLMAIVADPATNQLPDTQGRPLTVAVRRGVIIAEMTAERLGMVPFPADSYRQMRALLERRRVDLILVSDIEGLSPSNDTNWNNLGVLPEPVTHFTLYHYLHRRHSHLAQPLADALRELDYSGEKSRIVKQIHHQIIGPDSHDLP